MNLRTIELIEAIALAVLTLLGSGAAGIWLNGWWQRRKVSAEADAIEEKTERDNAEFLFTQLRSEVDRLNELVKSLSDELKLQKAENDTTRRELDQLRNTRVNERSEMTNEIIYLKSKVEALESENTELKARIAELEEHGND